MYVFLSEVVGLILIVVAWFNFFNFSLPARILLFILGFDMTGLAFKIGVFALSYFFLPFLSTLAWALLLLTAVEVISSFLLIGLLGKVIKSIAVFFIGYFVVGIEFALILAVIDLLLNLGLRKII
jgi:hypothetical protein